MRLAVMANQKFQETLNKLVKSDLPLKAAFKLKGMVAVVQKELEKYDECRKEALDRLGEKGEDGQLLTDENNQVQLSEESTQQFFKEMSELLEVEVEVGTLSINELGEKCELSVEDLTVLESLITG